LLNDFAEPPSSDLMEGLYPLRKGLGTTIVAINELPVVPETLWLRLVWKGGTQEMTIADLLMMPDSDPKCGKQKLMVWNGICDRILYDYWV
jgi:hypothetical protein